MPQQDPVKPGQVTSLPQNNYDPNAEAGRVVNNLPYVASPTAPNLLFDSTAPTTAEGASKVNPAYAMYINTLKNANGKQAFLEQPYYTPERVAERYSNREIGGYHPYDMNLENWYGDNQSWFTQWGNRLGKFGTKAVGSFANALMDIPNIVNASAQGNFDKMWDNPVNNWATDLMEWSEKAMPNYETNWEREHPFANLIPLYGFFSGGSSANSWGKVVENLGFTVGAIGGAVAEDVVVGALTGGVGEVPLAAMQINKAVYKLGKMVNTGEDFLGALKTNIKNADEIIKGLRGVDRFNYAVRQGLWGANMITSGVSEAAFEGIESYKTLSKDLQQKYFEETGKAPSFEENQKIDALARDAANSRFLLNSALLAVTNSVQWGNLFRPLNATKELLEAEAKQGVRVALKEGSIDAFEAVDHASKLAKWGKKITDNTVVKLLTGSASEGFEEGTQYAIEKGVNDFYKRKYEDKNITTTNNFLKSFGTGMAEAMGTKEGWENIVLGLLGGALYKGGEYGYYKARGINNNPNYKQQVDAVLDGLNTQSLTGIFENKYGPAVEAISIQEDMQTAAAKNDVFQYKNYKHDQFVNFILSGISQNKFETRMDQLSELKKLEGAEFEKLFGIPASTENKKTVDGYVGKLEENARHMKEVHKRVSRTFINPFSYKGTGNYKNAEEKKKQDEINDKYIAYEQAKDDIIRLSSISKDSADRIRDLRSQISAMQTVIDPHTTIRLASQDGLKELKKEYKEKKNIADDALKLAADAKNTRDSKWYSEKIEEIDAILNEKDEKAQNTLYNKFLNNVFDRTQKENSKFYESYGTDAQKAAVDAPFPRDVIKDVISLGADIYYLQKRNEVAVDRYARLTTKGGFKGLFDQIQQARKDANDFQVPLQQAQTQGQAAQQQAAFNTAQQQQGQAPTAQPQAATTNQPTQSAATQPPTTAPQQQGYVEDLGIIKTEEEERAELVGYLIEAVDGKRTLSEVEASILGFKTIDDLKFDNPNMKVEDYIMIKTQSKKNYYILKTTVEEARKFMNEWNSRPSNVSQGSVTPTGTPQTPDTSSTPTPPSTPNTPPPSAENGGFRTDDYMAKVFVPLDEKIAFNDAIFSGTKDQVKQGISVVVKPLASQFQQQYDQQSVQQSFIPVTGFPGMFVAKAPYDFPLLHNGKEIAKVAYPKRLLFRVGNEFVNIDRLTPEQYQRFTNKPAAQHAADVDEYNKQVAFTNLLALRFRNNGLNEITLNEQEFNELLDIVITYGELDLIPVGTDRPLYNQLKYNTVKLPAGNNNINTMVILSAPKRQMDEDGVMVRERTGSINPIYGQNFYDNPNADDTAVLDFIANSADAILKVNSRYIGMVSKPDGSFALIALRPAEMESATKRNLFQTLKDRSAESIRVNFVPSTKEESPKNVLLIGDQEVYYKLPTDAAKDYNKEFNETINNNMFVSDPNGKVWFEITLSPIGALRLEIHEPNSGYRTRLIIAPQKVENLDSFQAMLDAFNKEIEKRVAKEVKEKGDSFLRGLNLRLNTENFRQNIADDSNVANAEALASQLTSATSTEVFKNGTMKLVPNNSKISNTYKKERGSTAKATPEQTAQASETPQTSTPEQTSTPAMPQGLTSLTQQISQSEQDYNSLEDVFGPKIPTGIFAGMNATPVDESGTIQPTSPKNQEDQSDIVYSSVKEALNANDIDYKTVNGNTQFFTISSGEILDMPGVSPKDLAASMKLNVKEQQKPKGDSGLDFMLSNKDLTMLNNMMNFENARTYINSILPSFIRVEDMDAVMEKIREQGIENPETDVWGAFKDGIIYLNKQAPSIGQEYHEAFHAVFNIFLPQEEQQKLLEHAKNELYKKLKKEGKSIKQYIAEQRKIGVWSNLSEGQAVSKAAEEWMAEEFRKYKNNKKSDSLLDKLFDLIERFFRWITRSQNDLNALFQKIDTGGYKYSNIAYNSFIQDTTDENTTQEFKFMLVPARPTTIAVGRGTIEVKRNLDSKTSTQVIQNVAAYFEMYKKTGDFSGITDDKLLDQILDDLRDTYSANNPRYEGMTQEQLNIIANSDENYIYSNEETRAVIKDAAKKYINSMSYFEQFEEEELEEGQQDTGTPSTGYDNKSENVGGFSSLPGMLRHYLGFTSYEVQDRFGNPTLANGKPVIATIDAVSVYYGLLRATANINDPVKFFQRMIRFGDNNEQSRHFIDKFILDSGLNTEVLFNENRIEANRNKALVEQVRKGFNKYRIDYVFTEYDMQKGKYRSYHANRKNVENVQFDSWSNRFIDGYSEMTSDQQAVVRRAVDNVRNRYFDQRRATKRTAEETNAIVTEVRNTLLSVGIQLSFDFIKYSLLSINAKRYDALNKDYKAQGAQLQFDDPQNTFISKADYSYVQVMKIADEITLNKDFMDELSRTLSSNGNPFFRKIKEPSGTEQMKDEADSDEDQVDTAMTTRITNIAKGNALFDETVGESSYMNADDKLVFAHQDGTFNVKYSYGLRDAETRRRLRETGIRNEAEAALDSYDSAWLTDNFLMQSTSFEAVADNLLFQNIDGIRAVETNKEGKVITEEFRDQKEGVTYGSYSPREFLINLTNLYISYAKTQKTGAGDVITTPHLIRVLEASKTANTVNLPINLDVYREGTVTEKTLDILLKEVQKEFNRIARVQGEVGTLTENIVENYHTGSFAEDGFTVSKGFRGLKFTDNMTSIISKATANILERKARTGQEMSQEDMNTIKEEIKNSLNKMVEDAIDLMVAEGVIRLGPKGLSYQNVLLHRDFFVGNKDLNLQSVDKGIRFKTNIGHVLINDYINTLAFNQILHGDPALSLKNDGGIDAVKRAKGDNASITSIRTDLIATDLGITEAFTHSKVAIFKEPIAVDGTKVADAQMYTTIRGLRYTLWGLGRLSPRIARFLDALERGEDIHNLVDSQGNTFDGVFDDNNGLLAWDEMTNSLKLVFKDGKTYYKMSVVVLQPSLTATKNEDGTWTTLPGWETLDNLRRKMEADGIHFAAPESASKMMTLDVSKAKDFSDLRGHLVDNQYFGLQTENPSNKLEITTPTQLLQLIDSEQIDSTEVYFQGTKTNIGEVRKIYQNAVSQKVSNSFDSALNDIYDISEFSEDMDKLIVEGKVAPRLAKFYKRVSSTLEASGSDAQLLDFFSVDENGNIKFNANLSAIKTKSQQLYLSYFSKGVLSQKNPGYTIALFSGIDTKTPRIAKRVVNGQVIEWEYVRRDQWASNYNGVRDKQILGSRDQVTEEGQLFLDELQHLTPQYNEAGEVIGHYSEMMLPAHFAELLGLQPGDEIPEAVAWMFGVRIPSQDKHSFISLRLIDFLPANLGSTGMFPKEIVKLSGADFDIDKVFITRYDFYMKKDKNGKTTYHKYGEATSDRAKWAEYKRWMLENNKSLKNTVRDILLQDSTYQSLKDEQQVLRELQMEEVFDDAAKQLKKELYDRAVSQALAQLKLPSNQEEFTEASKTKELNNGVLNNKILDSYRALLTNTSMHEIANTPASLDALAEIQDNNDIVLRDANGNKIGSVFQKKTNYPVDSMLGKFYGFKNNTTGKNNIGIDVNANLIYSVANKGEIILEQPEGENAEPNGFIFDGHHFASFSGNREYNPETQTHDGKRTNDVLSTLITAATDEAKEQLNALYNLGVDALKVVNYLVSLKVPLKTAIYFVNQPSIRNYLDIKAVKQNTIQTKEEENLYRDAFRMEALLKTQKQIKDYKDMSDNELFGMFETNGLVEVRC